MKKKLKRNHKKKFPQNIINNQQQHIQFTQIIKTQQNIH